MSDGTQAEWMREIGEACDDLGYLILHLEPGSIELTPRRGSDRERITVESIFLSGAYLRAVLQAVHVKVEA